MLKVDLDLGYPGFELSAALAAGEGEFWGLVGPSGSGKSTLLSAIAGLVRPRRGEVVLGDQVFFRHRERERAVWLTLPRRRVGYLTQENDLFPHLNVRQNLTYGTGTTAHLDELVSLLELDGLLDRRPAHLSGGQKSRVALGRILAGQPRLLLLDEPFAALDWHLRRRLGEFLLRLQGRYGFTVIMATHDLEELPRLCSHVAVLGEGRVLQAGDVSGVLEAPAGAAAAAALGYHLLPVEVPETGLIKIGPTLLTHPSATETGRAVLAFHPACLRSLPCAEDVPGLAITGKVTRRVEYGGTAYCRVALPGGGEVLLEKVPEAPPDGAEVVVGLTQFSLFPFWWEYAET